MDDANRPPRQKTAAEREADILAAMWGAETPRLRLDRIIDRALKTAIAAVLAAIAISLALIFIGDRP